MFGSALHPAISLIKKSDRSSKIAKQLEQLSKKAVYVGVPEDENDRKSGDMTNALLAFIHTNGAPAQNIPPRPFLQPAIEANKDAIAKLQVKVLKAVLSGQDADPGLHAIGMFARDAVKRWWDDPRNNWPPNAPLTIARKGSSHPLLDTAQLKNAQTYVIRKA